MRHGNGMDRDIKTDTRQTLDRVIALCHSSGARAIIGSTFCISTISIY